MLGVAFSAPCSGDVYQGGGSHCPGTSICLPVPSDAGPPIPRVLEVGVGTERGSAASTLLPLVLPVQLLSDLRQLQCSCGCKVTWTKEFIRLKTSLF